MYYTRMIENDILQSIVNNPVTAILGPRQCGKSTLAKHIAAKYGVEGCLYNRGLLVEGRFSTKFTGFGQQAIV